MSRPLDYARDHQHGRTAIAVDEVNGTLRVCAIVSVTLQIGDAPLAICDQAAIVMRDELESAARHTPPMLRVLADELAESRRKEATP